jgi:DNA-binding IclR family transcriptional regulator
VKVRSILAGPLFQSFRYAKLRFVPRIRRNTAKSEEASKPDRKFVGALGRGLDVLRCFGPRDRWLANQEIAARTGLARPTVSRLVYTLTQLGFLRHAHAQRKYALGGAAVSLGYSALTQIDIRRAARPLLHALSQQTNASVHLAINDGLHMQVVDTYWHSAVFVIDIGSRVPVATTSLGRAYVCALPEEERKSILEQIRSLRPADWSLVRRRFEQALREYEQYGFCLALGDWRRDVNAVAAPFDPRDGTKPLVVGCSGAAFQLRPELLKREIGPRLLSLVGNLRGSLHPA